jgi:hypothetical protein
VVATSPIGRASVNSPAPALAPALVQELSPAHVQQPAHGHRHAMCKTLLICRIPAAATSAAVGHPADLVTPRRSPAARSQVEQPRNFCKTVRATLVFPISPEIESMQD